MQHILVAFCIALTLAAYAVFRRLYLRHNAHPLLNVVILSSAAVAGVILALNIPLDTYAQGRDIMTFPLGPATVGLAVPLYRCRKLIGQYALAIAASVACGSLLAMLSAGLIARWGGLPREVVMSIIPKGVSIPFAVEIASLSGGIPPLAAAFVVATGTLGGLIGAPLLTRLRITDPVARGLSLGTAAHAQGTAAALMEGQLPGSMAGLAMILAGMFTAACAPLAVWLLG